jgi:EAL domain-containing protein (putative c-di-GMP-specific phosphodiesterase class I)
MNELHGLKLLEAVISLCHSIGIECVAEGVEQPEQLQCLRDMGCDYYQGYLFAKPMPMSALASIVDDEARWPVVARSALI